MPTTLYLRRPPDLATLVFGYRGRPGIEIDPPAAGAASPEPIAVGTQADGDTILYCIGLPDGCRVRPGDWRAMIHDHQAIGELMTLIVKDNVREALFETWSDELAASVERRLTLALGDLARVFDLQSVEGTAVDAYLHITVNGEFKNGERVALTVLVRADR